MQEIIINTLFIGSDAVTRVCFENTSCSKIQFQCVCSKIATTYTIPTSYKLFILRVLRILDSIL